MTDKANDLQCYAQSLRFARVRKDIYYHDVFVIVFIPHLGGTEIIIEGRDY